MEKDIKVLIKFEYYLVGEMKRFESLPVNNSKYLFNMFPTSDKDSFPGSPPSLVSMDCFVQTKDDNMRG